MQGTVTAVPVRIRLVGAQPVYQLLPQPQLSEHLAANDGHAVHLGVLKLWRHRCNICAGPSDLQPSGPPQRDATAQARQLVVAGLQQLSLPPTDPQFARLAEMKRQLRVHSPDGAGGDATPAAGSILRSFERSSEYSFQAQLPWTLTQEGAAPLRHLLAHGQVHRTSTAMCRSVMMGSVGSAMDQRVYHPTALFPEAASTSTRSVLGSWAEARGLNTPCQQPVA